MTKIILSIAFALITMQSFAQAGSDSALMHTHSVSYRLFPTKNMWTFIELNTRNGQMWQVQYDVEGANRGWSVLSLTPLVSKEKEVNDRFTLYSTQNMFTFILLDQLDGRTWQVQWSFNPKERIIIPIE